MAREGLMADIRIRRCFMIFMLVRASSSLFSARVATVEGNRNVAAKPAEVDASRLQFRNIGKIAARDIIRDAAKARWD
jgi:hypothetical protein